MTQLTATIGGRPILTAYSALTEDSTLTFVFILFCSLFVFFLLFLFFYTTLAFPFVHSIYKFEKGKEK